MLRFMTNKWHGDCLYRFCNEENYLHTNIGKGTDVKIDNQIQVILLGLCIRTLWIMRRIQLHVCYTGGDKISSIISWGCFGILDQSVVYDTTVRAHYVSTHILIKYF